MNQRRGSIIGPLILITIGILLLLSNFGYINNTFWLSLVRFWPLILVLAGLEILFGRTLRGQLIVLLIGILAIGGIFWLQLNPAFLPLTTAASTEAIIQTRDGVQAANLELNSGVGELNIHALTAPSPNWIEGTVAHPSGTRLEQTYQVTADVAHFKLDTKGTAYPFGTSGERWDLALAPQIPLTLKLDAGVGGSKIDLNGLDVTAIDLDTGVGGMDVVMPSHAGTVTAKLNGGIGGLTIYIPQGVPARIRSHSGIGGVSINQTRFPRISDELYESTDYATATDRIDLTVDAGIGGITIP